MAQLRITKIDKGVREFGQAMQKATVALGRLSRSFPGSEKQYLSNPTFAREYLWARQDAVKAWG